MFCLCLKRSVLWRNTTRHQAFGSEAWESNLRNILSKEFVDMFWKYILTSLNEKKPTMLPDCFQGKITHLKDLTDEKFMSSQKMNLPWQRELSQMVIYFSPLSCVCSFCNCPGDHPIFIFNCGKHEKLTHSDTTESDRARKKSVIFNWEQLDNLLCAPSFFILF